MPLTTSPHDQECALAALAVLIERAKSEQRPDDIKALLAVYREYERAEGDA